MAGRNDDNSNNLPGDFLKSRRSNNTRPTRSSNTKSSKETDDTLKDLDLTSRKVKEVNEQKLKSEKKITEEKQKQNKEDDKHIASSKQDVKLLKEVQGLRKDLKASQEAELRLKKQSEEQDRKREESLKRQRDFGEKQIRDLKKQFDLAKQDFDFDAKVMDFKEKMSKSQLKNTKYIFDAQLDLHSKEMKNLEEQRILEEQINKGTIKSQEKAYEQRYNLLKVQREINKEQENYNKLLDLQANSKQVLTDSLAKGLGINTGSSTYKLFSGQGKTDSEKALLKASAKMETASAVLETASKALKTILNKWLDRFTNGINNIYNTYEQTYTKIASVMDTNQKSYHEWQNNVSKDLQDQGLNSAVTVSQAMSELERLASDGFTDMTKASQMSIQNIQNRIINPFVDTTSDAYENLQNLFGTNFTNKITGMSSYLSDISGSNRVFKSSINDVIDKLEPVALSAKKDLLGDSYRYVEELVKGGDMTQKQAIELISQATDAVADPYGALTSGNTAVAASVAQGKYNSVEEMIESIVDKASLAQSNDVIAQGAALQALTGSSNGMFSSRTNFDNVKKRIRGISNSDVSSSPESYYSEQLSKLKNGQLTTETQQKANIAENASTFVATLREAFPDAYDSIVSIASTVKEILAAIIGGAILKGIGGISGKSGMLSGVASKVGSGLSSAGTYLGSGLANGFSNAAPTAFGAGKIGALTGTAGAVAGAAGALAGGAMAVKGTTDVVKDFKSGNVNAGTAMSATGAVGGAVGTTALLALGASNPVGWVALAIGGAALLGRKLYDSAKEAEEHAKSLKDTAENNKKMAKDIKSQWDNVNSSIQEEADARVQSLKDIKSGLSEGKTLQKTRNDLINSGILSEEDVNKARTADKDALEDLVDKYITETNRLSQEDQDFNNIFSDYQQDIVGGARNELARYLNDHKDNEKDNANYDQVYDVVKKAVDRTYEKQRNGGSLSESEENLLKKWEWAGKDNDVSRSDLKSLINKVGDQSITQMLTTEDLDNLAKGSNGSSYGEHMTTYRSDMTDDSVVTQFRDIFAKRSSITKDEAAKALNSLGYRPDTSNGAYNKAIAKIMEIEFKDGKKVQFDYNSEKYYRTGSNYIGYDQIAQLHEGESVLTKAATSNLKELVGDTNIKDLSSGSITSNISDGMSSVSSVIVDQTKTLVSKLDEIISVVSNLNPGVNNISTTAQKISRDASEFALA